MSEKENMEPYYLLHRIKILEKSYNEVIKYIDELFEEIEEIKKYNKEIEKQIEKQVDYVKQKAQEFLKESYTFYEDWYFEDTLKEIISQLELILVTLKD